MLQSVTAVRETAHGKYWLKLSCEHQVLCCDSVQHRGSVHLRKQIECPFCIAFDFEVGDEVELRLTYAHIPVVAKYMGHTSCGRMRFIFPVGEDSVCPIEIIGCKKIH